MRRVEATGCLFQLVASRPAESFIERGDEMTPDLYDEFLNLLCAKRELRRFFESMPGVITREKLGRHIQDRPKANHRLIKALYFKDSLAEIVQYYFERDEKPSKEELMAQFELKDILQPANPITGYREVSYQNDKERNFLSAIADVFSDVIKTLRISMHTSIQALPNHVSQETGEQPPENISAPAATGRSEEQGAEQTVTNGTKELDSAEHPVTVEDIQAALKADDRKKAVEVWQQRQLSLEKPHTKTALYDRAGEHKSDFYKWLKGNKPKGYSTDRAINRVLTTDWK